MTNTGIKSNNMSDVIVYLAMFSTTIDYKLVPTEPYDYFDMLMPIPCPLFNFESFPHHVLTILYTGDR